MNEAEQNLREAAIDVRQLARAIRFALVSIILGLSYLSLRTSLSIEHFRQIFADMLGGLPLPALTAFVLSAHTWFLAFSVMVPVAALATLFLRHLVKSFYIIGVLALITTAQFITLYHGLSAPLTQIITGMSSGPVP